MLEWTSETDPCLVPPRGRSTDQPAKGKRVWRINIQGTGSALPGDVRLSRSLLNAAGAMNCQATRSQGLARRIAPGLSLGSTSGSAGYR